MKQNVYIISLILLASLSACTSNTVNNRINSDNSAQINNNSVNQSTSSEERASTHESGDELGAANNTPEKESAKGNPQTYDLPVEISEAELKTLDGKSVKLSDYKGKVVLVNMWATWCGPCRMEIPELVKLNNELKDQVKIVGLTLEEDYRGNTQEAVSSYVKEQNIPYDIVWATEDVWNELITLTPRPSIPQSFVMNRAGQLTAIFIGFNAARTPASVRKALDEALKSES